MIINIFELNYNTTSKTFFSLIKIIKDFFYQFKNVKFNKSDRKYEYNPNERNINLDHIVKTLNEYHITFN